MQQTLTPERQAAHAAGSQTTPAMTTHMPNSTPVMNLTNEDICLETRNLNLFYGQKQALYDVNMLIPRKRVTAFIGPSGCGKSTLLRIFNRMYDLYPGQRAVGQLMLDNTRMQLARQYLNDRALSVAEIAVLLGFSEQSAFTRAFKRWTGLTPLGFRQQSEASLAK